MSELKKITAQQMDEQGVCAAPNILNGTPAENKGIFDRMVRQLVAPAYNEMVEAVDLINSQQEEWSQEEQGRKNAEASRSAAETGRQAAETERQAAEEIRKQNEAAREAAEKNRKDGTTFVPEVSEDGVLSWSNSDGKQNPESRNIRGATGPAGMVISREEPTDPSHPAWLDPDGEEVSGLLYPVEKTEGMTQPVGRDEEGKLWTEPTGGGSGGGGTTDHTKLTNRNADDQHPMSAITGLVDALDGKQTAGDYIPVPATAEVGQTAVVKAVDETGKPTEWEAADMASGSTTTTDAAETVTVGTENVVLDSTAALQTVNLAWAVSGAKTVPAFTNYYIEKSDISYPRAFDTSGYVQTWSTAYHGNADAYVSGHSYFCAMYYEMDNDSTADLANWGTFVTPSGTKTISGSGWVYGIQAPSTSGSISFALGKTATGTGTIRYLYCIDVTALQEAGTITATTINELAELFGGLELVPGQDYEGSVTSGMATLNITRDGETTTVDSATKTAIVQGNDILVVEGGSVTFLLTVQKTVSVDAVGVWEGKKWVAFGDSLTDETINADKKYYRYIEEKTGITVVVMGKGGTGYYKTYDSGTAYGQRMANVPADADVITIFGSVNDWHTKSANVAMGNASDTMEAGTLAGYINECIDVAIEKAPYAQIALVTPMDYRGLPDDTLESIANIIKDVAAYRRIKCLDLYHESGFRVDNDTFAAVYTTDYSETDETFGHPSNLAHEQLIAPEFMELLKRMILTA